MVDAQPEQPEQQADEVTDLIPTTFDGEDLLAKWTPEEREARKEEIKAMVQAYNHFTDRTDNYRDESASDYGGFWLLSERQASVMRSAVGEIIGVSQEFLMN